MEWEERNIRYHPYPQCRGGRVDSSSRGISIASRRVMARRRNTGFRNTVGGVGRRCGGVVVVVVGWAALVLALVSVVVGMWWPGVWEMEGGGVLWVGIMLLLVVLPVPGDKTSTCGKQPAGIWTVLVLAASLILSRILSLPRIISSPALALLPALVEVSDAAPTTISTTTTMTQTVMVMGRVSKCRSSAMGRENRGGMLLVIITTIMMLRVG